MSTDIDAYFAPLRAQIKRVPRDTALEVAALIFHAVVEKTRIDSGQAALNWFFEPYEGDAPAMNVQEMMWGYGKVYPTTPAGFKGSHGANTDSVFMYQFEYLSNQMSIAPEHMTGVYIYNPIAPGFSGFNPGSDLYYADNALRSIDIDAISQAALAQVEGSYTYNG